MGSFTGQLLSGEIQGPISFLERSLWPGGGTGAGGEVTSIRNGIRHLVTLELFKVHFKEKPL